MGSKAVRMHKKIGILGGMTPESTVTYYRHIFRRYHELFGNLDYPETIIYDVSFQRFSDWMGVEDWESIEEALLSGLTSLKAAGADFAIIATNTMHILFDSLQSRSPLPLLSIMDATAEAIKEEGMERVGLLGTRFTMEKSFYKDGLAKHGIDSLVPEKEERDYVNKVIFEELSIGQIIPESRNEYLNIIESLVEKGAEGIVLGCTEIPLLITPEHTSVKLFDTTIIHAEKALQYALKTG